MEIPKEIVAQFNKLLNEVLYQTSENFPSVYNLTEEATRSLDLLKSCNLYDETA